MKFPAPFFLLAILFAASPLAAKNSQPQFNTIAVKHFANAGGMNQSPNLSMISVRVFAPGLKR